MLSFTNQLIIPVFGALATMYQKFKKKLTLTAHPRTFTIRETASPTAHCYRLAYALPFYIFTVSK
jgi:hypothetical protein